MFSGDAVPNEKTKVNDTLNIESHLKRNQRREKKNINNAIDVTDVLLRFDFYSENGLPIVVRRDIVKYYVAIEF